MEQCPTWCSQVRLCDLCACARRCHEYYVSCWAPQQTHVTLAQRCIAMIVKVTLAVERQVLHVRWPRSCMDLGS